MSRFLDIRFWVPLKGFAFRLGFEAVAVFSGDMEPGVASN